jgi:hypothetical protein
VPPKNSLLKDHIIVADDERPYDRARRARLALVISIILNLIGLTLFWHLFILPRDVSERRSRTEIVTLTHKPRVVAEPVVVQPRVVRRPPRPQVRVQRPVVAVAPAPPARAPHLAKHPLPPHAAPRRAELAKNGGGSPTRSVPVEAVPGNVTAQRPQLSAQKLAQIEQDLQGDIDAERGAHGPLAVAPEPAPTMKRYAMDVGDLTTGELNHHGLCDPISDWKADGFDYYYVACNVRFSDGTVQRQDVPWPVRFPPGDDPFNGTSHRDEPLAMPLPGWHLPPGETVTVELREYAHDHGVEI